MLEATVGRAKDSSVTALEVHSRTSAKTERELNRRLGLRAEGSCSGRAQALSGLGGVAGAGRLQTLGADFTNAAQPGEQDINPIEGGCNSKWTFTGLLVMLFSKCPIIAPI